MRYIFVFIFLLFSADALATQYFYFDAEDEVSGSTLPLAGGEPANFCQTECGGSGDKGTVQAGETPNGSNYFQWLTEEFTGTHTGSNNAAVMTDSAADWGSQTMSNWTIMNLTDGSSCGASSNDTTTVTCTLSGGTENDWDTGDSYVIYQHSHYTEIASDTMPTETGWPITLIEDTTYYLGFFFNYQRIDSVDIWHDGSSTQSGDKGVEVDGSGVRLLFSFGQWDHMSGNTDHKYTVWPGVLITSNEGVTWGHNSSGYTTSNPIQLDYETWYAGVLEFTLSDAGAGVLKLYVNGTLVESHTNLNTSTGDFSISRLTMGGTMAQSAYDAPKHYRKFDSLILTDSLTDLQNLGLMSNPEISPVMNFNILSTGTTTIGVGTGSTTIQ